MDIKDNTFRNVAFQLGLRQSTIRHFCRYFEIPLYEQFIKDEWSGTPILKVEFIRYLQQNAEFLLDFQEDYYKDKTPTIISQTINRDLVEVETYLKNNHPNYFKDGVFMEHMKLSLRYVSSYNIDYRLGGDYGFLKFNNTHLNNQNIQKLSKPNELEIVGYEDILISITEQIEPILNPSDIKDWGLTNPGGILLFGPPGCGKTFWAEKISEILEYTFIEIPRSIFGSSLVDGAMINLKNKLDEYSNSTKTVLFFDEFDSIASSRNYQPSGSRENSKVVNTLLQEIPKLIEKQILIVAATNFIDSIDPAVIRPGRFDLKIPVFPPNFEERADLIVNKLTYNLQSSSPLLRILKYNNAQHALFWKKIASEMVLFSNSLVIDFTQLLKRRLKSIYNETQSIEINLDEEILIKALNETSAKLTQKDAELCAHFYNEVKSLGSSYYQERLDWLYQDLERYYSRVSKEKKPKPIGFRRPIID
ncbi:ATP-binding protein [Weeksellaceae bacterium KMM 9724]|uniref:AAA family ATPase n=1 Tax=Profundicola chukchiensis TaxID=2961959 RepID=UPI0024384344|nr:ATP-binding protein [Profundicola chukchiensis]MDG4949781.1 ATP-binding protein [Profundicola chukchiensis]